MRRGTRSRTPRLRKKCLDCVVAKRMGGCLFNCNRKEKLMLELRTLIEAAASEMDPLLEQLRQCPELFQVGEAVERLCSLQRQEPDQILPPTGAVMSPFV